MSRPAGWQFSGPACTAREITARLVGPVLSIFLEGPSVHGAEHLDELTGPALICPTHASHFDFSALRLALGPKHRRRIAVTAAADYFTVSRVRWFFAAWLGAFPFDRGGRRTKRSLEAAESFLSEGWHVLVFPEGTRSVSGEIGPFRPGVGLLAAQTGCQVLPVRITGISKVLPKGSRRPHRAPVEVRFGAPVRAQSGESPRDFAERLESVIRAL